MRKECLTVGSGALLIGYWTALSKPENVYGEDFGIRRCKKPRSACRARAAHGRGVTDGCGGGVAGTPEQADEMTVIVARFR